MSIDTAALAAYRLADVRKLLRRQTFSSNYQLLHDANIVDAATLRKRHWNICRSLATPENATLLASESAWADVWEEVHRLPVYLMGRLNSQWQSQGTRVALSRQLVLSSLGDDGTYLPIHSYNAETFVLLPEMLRLEYTVESHFSTSIQEALQWLGIKVDGYTAGPAPQPPLTMLDRSVQLERGSAANTFDVLAFGGVGPYVFTIESQSTAGVFSISGDTLSVNVAGLTLSDGTVQTVVLKVTDANGDTDTATYTLKTSTE